MTGNFISDSDTEDWQARAKRAGLPQKVLAKMLGVSQNTMSAQLRGLWTIGTPQYVKFAIVIWEQSPQSVKDYMLDWAEKTSGE